MLKASGGCGNPPHSKSNTPQQPPGQLLFPEDSLFQARRQTLYIGKPKLPEGWSSPLEALIANKMKDFAFSMKASGKSFRLEASIQFEGPATSEHWKWVRKVYEELFGDLHAKREDFNKYYEIKHMIDMLEFAQLYGPEILNIQKRHFFNPEYEYLMKLFNSNNLGRAVGESQKNAELPMRPDSRSPAYPPVPAIEEIQRIAKLHKGNILIIVPHDKREGEQTVIAGLIDLATSDRGNNIVNGACVSEASAFARKSTFFEVLKSSELSSKPGPSEKLLWELFRGGGAEYGILILYSKDLISEFLAGPNKVNCIISIGEKPFQRHRLEIDKHPGIPTIYVLKVGEEETPRED